MVSLGKVTKHMRRDTVMALLVALLTIGCTNDASSVVNNVDNNVVALAKLDKNNSLSLRQFSVGRWAVNATWEIGRQFSGDAAFAVSVVRADGSASQQIDTMIRDKHASAVTGDVAKYSTRIDLTTDSGKVCIRLYDPSSSQAKFFIDKVQNPPVIAKEKCGVVSATVTRTY